VIIKIESDAAAIKVTMKIKLSAFE